MFRVKVGFDTEVEKRPTKTEGRYFYNQTVWLFQPGAEYPLKIVLVIPEDVGQSAGYAPGEYILDLDKSVDQGRFKSVDIGFQQKLIPFSVEAYQRKIQLLTQQMNEQAEAYSRFREQFKDNYSVAFQRDETATEQTTESKPSAFPTYGIKAPAKKAA